jgi:hypothetical protein
MLSCNNKFIFFLQVNLFVWLSRLSFEYKYFCSFSVSCALRIFNVENMHAICLFSYAIFYQLSTVFSTNFGMLILQRYFYYYVDFINRSI